MFPSLSASTFGLVQERLSQEPFRVLVAVIFLNQTRGSISIPYCEALFSVYKSPEEFSNADSDALVNFIRPLGLQNKRAEAIIKLARAWVENSPKKGKRYRRLDYPAKDDGKDVKKAEEPLTDDDPRSAWEIAHLPGLGPYAIDSWRIFCRDVLRGLHCGLTSLDTDKEYELEMSQEWTRVEPLDKELRMYLRWRWLRLGWLWDPVTGHRVRCDQDIIGPLERKELISCNGFPNPWMLDVEPAVRGTAD
jgi:methyl-CpG-binding domain protein 4